MSTIEIEQTLNITTNHPFPHIKLNFEGYRKSVDSSTGQHLLSFKLYTAQGPQMLLHRRSQFNYHYSFLADGNTVS